MTDSPRASGISTRTDAFAPRNVRNLDRRREQLELAQGQLAGLTHAGSPQSAGRRGSIGAMTEGGEFRAVQRRIEQFSAV